MGGGEIIKNLFKILLIFILTIFFISASSANELNDDSGDLSYISQENTNVIELSDDEEISVLGNSIYFDANAANEGSGTQNNPYKTFSASKLGYGDTSCYFAPGQYTFSDSVSFFFGSVEFIGTSNNPNNTVLKYTGSGNVFGSGLSSVNSVTVKGITLSGLTLKINSNVEISNAIIENAKGIANDNGNNYGGAISLTESNSKLTVDNTIFRNNNAEYGGAIYIKGSTATITNSKFVNNVATQFGGSIVGENGANIIVKNSDFKNSNSKFDAGASIYIKNAQSSVSYSNFTGSTSFFGPAVTSLNSSTTIDHIIASDNNASFEGGAIYSMYGSLKVTSSVFNSNSAKYGGAIFADNLTSFECRDCIFNNNFAYNTAGAIYALANSRNTIVNPSYNGNNAGKENNYFESKSFDLNIVHDDSQIMIYDSSYNGYLPSKYDLRDYGYVSSMRNQGDSGNCWAYATIAALESCILKATGTEYDLSEGNLKNLAQYFSDYGWSYETNEGGFYRMATGYLTGWLGPVLEIQDLTDDKDFVSAVFDSVMHVQNVLYIQRTSYTDNDAIKRAIMDYGAVATEIYFQNSGYYYSQSNGAYYYYDGNQINHAVAIVGWDDNYSRNNFVRAPAGDGAFIIKNSYGNQWGKDNSGFGYVSYYDTAFARFNIPYSTFTFILNDTVKFNKNYQYETTSWTDYFVTGKNTIYYENVFTSTGNDLLAAFSTYFNASKTNWEAKVYVNDELMLTQNGVSSQGYYTINLDSQIPLKTGDKFKIALKISCDGFASFPISENTRYGSTRMNYIPGVSFFSYDGERWYDLYDYKVNESYGHRYSSQVACIKAFTVSNDNDSSVKTRTEIIRADSGNIVASIKAFNNEIINFGNVTFKINDNKTVVDVKNGQASLKCNLKPGTYNIEVYYNANDRFDYSKANTILTIDKESLNINISARDTEFGEDLIIRVSVTDNTGNIVSLPVNITIDNKTYHVKDSILNISNLKPGTYTILCEVGESASYSSSSVTREVNVSKIDTTFILNCDDIYFGETAAIDIYLANVNNARVTLTINSKKYDVSVKNEHASLTIPNLSVGDYRITGEFEGNDYYLKNTNFTSFSVKKAGISIKTTSDDIAEGELAVINIELSSNVNGVLTVEINENQYLGFIDNGKASVQVNNLNAGQYEYTVTFNGDNNYDYSSISGNLNVIGKNVTPIENSGIVISALNVTKYFSGSQRFIVRITDDNNNSLANKSVKVSINGNTYTRTTNSNGIISVPLNLNSGSYDIITTCDNISLNSQVIIKNTVNSNDLIKVYRNNSQFNAVFLDGEGNPLRNTQVRFNINGVYYNRTTNNNGSARLNINLEQGNYIITSINPKTGENAANNVSVLSRFSENHDVEMFYKNGSQYIVRLIGDNGSYAGKGEIVTFNINGVFYNRTTNDQGYARLNLKLSPGVYIITAEYRKCRVSNNIKIMPILSARDLVMNFKDGSKFTVQLVDGQGKALSGKSVLFNVNGVMYNRTTNDEGTAKLNINLQKGEYIITSSYNGENIANKITIN